jgi:hypothetical protein
MTGKKHWATLMYAHMGINCRIGWQKAHQTAAPGKLRCLADACLNFKPLLVLLLLLLLLAVGIWTALMACI